MSYLRGGCFFLSLIGCLCLMAAGRHDLGLSDGELKHYLSAKQTILNSLDELIGDFDENSLDSDVLVKMKKHPIAGLNTLSVYQSTDPFVVSSFQTKLNEILFCLGVPFSTDEKENKEALSDVGYFREMKSGRSYDNYCDDTPKSKERNLKKNFSRLAALYKVFQNMPRNEFAFSEISTNIYNAMRTSFYNVATHFEDGDKFALGQNPKMFLTSMKLSLASKLKVLTYNNSQP